MSETIRMYHERQKVLVPDDSGDIVVVGPDGSEALHRADSEDRAESFTEVVLPEGYAPNMTALSHLIDSLSSRHFDPEDVFAVMTAGGASADTVSVAKRLAALLEAEYAEDEKAVAKLRAV